MEYKMKNIIKKIIFAFVIIATIVLILGSQTNLKEIGAVLKTANYKYLLIALAVLIGYFILSLLGLLILSIYKKIKIKKSDLFLIGGTESFFNGITPFATGGQPFQAYAMYTKGVPLKDSTSLLIMNFITHMIATNLFAIASLAFYSKFVSAIPSFTWIVIMGFSINFLVLVLMFSLALNKGLRNLCCKAIEWLSKKELFKKLLTGKLETFNNYFDGMQQGCKELFAKPFVFISCIITKLAALLLYYLIPYYVLLAVHAPVGPQDLLYIILATSFAITMVVWVPTPGGTGGMELAFNSIFITIAGMTKALTTSGMVLWRLYTYYLLMLVGFIFYLIFIFKDNKIKKNQNINTNIKETIKND